MTAIGKLPEAIGVGEEVLRGQFWQHMASDLCACWDEGS